MKQFWVNSQFKIIKTRTKKSAKNPEIKWTLFHSRFFIQPPLFLSAALLRMITLGQNKICLSEQRGNVFGKNLDGAFLLRFTFVRHTWQWNTLDLCSQGFREDFFLWDHARSVTELRAIKFCFHPKGKMNSHSALDEKFTRKEHIHIEKKNSTVFIFSEG